MTKKRSAPDKPTAHAALRQFLAEPVRCAATMFDIAQPEIVLNRRTKTIVYDARRGVVEVDPDWLNKNVVETLGSFSEAQAAVLLSLVLKVFIERESKARAGREREIHVYGCVGHVLGDMGCPRSVVKRAIPVFVAAHESVVLGESERASCIEHGYDIAKEQTRKKKRRR